MPDPSLPPVQQILYTTMDTTMEVPAVTTLLHRVCGGDPKKFAEAVRLVELFIRKALEQ